MSLEMTIVMLIASWLAVACAMFWGVMRISRRHQHRNVRPTSAARVKPGRHTRARVAHAH